VARATALTREHRPDCDVPLGPDTFGDAETVSAV
jgi:hypothetical protein